MPIARHSTCRSDCVHSYSTSYIYLENDDADGTLRWLTRELHESEQMGEKAWIVGHIPNNDDTCIAAWTHNYYNIVKRWIE